MAGGKLTPRQKMINMMYLVLTALLALNVAKEILRSFDLISASLHTSAEKLREKNTNLGADIVNSVQKEVATGNNKNAPLIPQVALVNRQTNELVAKIEAMIADMKSEAIGGFDPVTGKVKAPDNVEKAYHYWMIGEGNDTDNEGRGAGKARELREALVNYINWANTWYKSQNGGKDYVSGDARHPGFAQIAIDPADDPSVPESDDDKQKKWEYYIFHGSPVIANIAMLEKFKNDIRVVEAECLGLLRGKLSEVVVKIDSLVAMDAPVSQVVAAGMPFETRLFVTASSRQARPRFSGSGNITMSPDGQSAIMKVFANGGVIPRGKNEGTQSYTASIQVPKADGSMMTLSLNKTFVVRKPEIVITSAAVQILYQNCGNDINIDVPALGDAYRPVITASDGARALQSPRSARTWRIVPPGSKVTLAVASNTNGQVIRIGTVDYRVIPPPKPTIRLGVDGGEWDGAKPIRMGSTVEVRCYPEPNFARALPNDARYQMQGVKLLAGSGLTAPVAVGPAQNSTMGPQYAAVRINVPRNLQPGNKVYFQMEDVVRINFENRQVKEPFSRREMTITATVR